MLGVKEALPLALSVSTSGLVFGLLGKQLGMTMLELTLMSALVFAGAAQFAALPLIASNLDPFSIALTTYIINLRYYLIAASLLPYWWGNKTKTNAFRAFFLTDEAYALTINRYEKGFYSTSYYWGVALSIYFGWVGATILGVLGGKLIPDPARFGLDFAFPAAFLGLIIPQLKSVDKLIVALASAVLSIWGSIYLPGKWYIILAGLAGSSLPLFFSKGEKSNE
jgi:4-azaleucine resistance transporter AzlC